MKSQVSSPQKALNDTCFKLLPTDLDGGFASDMRHEEVHGDILAVDVLVHHITYGLRHDVGIEVCVILRRERNYGF